MPAQTIYERHKSKWSSLESQGYVNLARMAKTFTVNPEMDIALGYVNATSKWNSRTNSRPSRQAESRAKTWLLSNEPKREQEQTTPAENDGSVMFLCVVSVESAAKVQKVLSLMGCEFVDI
jgi:hypothetical protein